MLLAKLNKHMPITHTFAMADESTNMLDMRGPPMTHLFKTPIKIPEGMAGLQLKYRFVVVVEMPQASDDEAATNMMEMLETKLARFGKRWVTCVARLSDGHVGLGVLINTDDAPFMRMKLYYAEDDMEVIAGIAVQHLEAEMNRLQRAVATKEQYDVFKALAAVSMAEMKPHVELSVITDID